MVYNVDMISIGGDFCFSDVGCTNLGAASYWGFLEACASQNHVRLFSSGRTAYANVWLNLKRTRPAFRKALVPSYLCYSMLSPLTRMGAEVHFYEVGPDLTVDADDLQRVAASVGTAPADLLVLVCNYFGFPETPEVLEATANLRAAGTAVVYDATHSAMCMPASAGTMGRPGGPAPFDVMVMSLRKSLPVVDGAVVLWMDGTAPAIEPGTWKHEAFYSARAQAMLLKAAHISDGFGAPGDYAMLFAQAEAALDRAFGPAGAMSPTSRSILRRVDVEHARHARRANYIALARELQGAKQPSGLRVFRPELPPDAVPLGLPILADDRDLVAARLESRGVHPELYWDLPADVPRNAFPASAHLADHLLMLPCDQRYSPADMATVASALRA